jgi:hypothetical protein
MWSQQYKILAKDGAADDYFGSSVCMYDTNGLIGAKSDDDKGVNSGAMRRINFI